MLKKILLGLSMLTLVGCATMQIPQKPIKPRIEAEYKDESVCFSKEDAYLLFMYIKALEDGYEGF